MGFEPRSSDSRDDLRHLHLGQLTLNEEGGNLVGVS